MHPIDRASALMLRFGPGRLKVFEDGWGDPDRLRELRSLARRSGPVLPLDVEWGPEERRTGIVVRDGRFAAPLDDLPPGAETGHVRMVRPAAGRTRRMCLLMPAWNEHAYTSRTSLADELAELGVGSLLLENPFYGRRRPADRSDPPIRTVVEFLAMGRAAVEEGRALLQYVRDHADFELGVSGYSMGGNLAGLVSATMPFPVATAPLAPSHSPAPVFVEGVLRRGIRWSALAAEPDPQAALGEALADASVLHHAVPDHVRHAVLVAGTRDGYIPLQAVRDFHEHWPGSELRLYRAGHATLLWRHHRRLVEAIGDAFDRTAAG